MGKGTYFSGQPVLAQLLNYVDRNEAMLISKSQGGERYVKHFNAWSHLATMLYATISGFDSLREISLSMALEHDRLGRLGVGSPARRSTLAEANARRPEAVFQAVRLSLYGRYHHLLSADSAKGREPKWLRDMLVIDSTTITLFSNLLFKGAGRNPRSGRKKGGLKQHTIIRAKEGVPCDVSFTSAATHDGFMLAPDRFERGDIVAMDRAYIDYAKMQRLTERGVTYVTKMKRNLRFDTISDVFHAAPGGGMSWRERRVRFHKRGPDGHDIAHEARIVSHLDQRRSRVVDLLTNDFDMPREDIIAIYLKRWKIESLFKQLKQNFPLRYFYGESANAIKTQVWCTLIANLLLVLLKHSVRRPWSFSGLATTVRIMLMRYVDCLEVLEDPDKNLLRQLRMAAEGAARAHSLRQGG